MTTNPFIETHGLIPASPCVPLRLFQGPRGLNAVASRVTRAMCTGVVYFVRPIDIAAVAGSQYGGSNPENAVAKRPLAFGHRLPTLQLSHVGRLSEFSKSYCFAQWRAGWTGRDELMGSKDCSRLLLQYARILSNLKFVSRPYTRGPNGTMPKKAP